MIDPATLPPTFGEDDPRGVLTFTRPLPEPLATLEDSTQAADHERAFTLGSRFFRPSTPTERDLLEALGYRDRVGQPPGGDLMTAVYVTGGIRSRSWLGLTIPEPTPAPPPYTPPVTPAPEPDPTPEPEPEPEPTTDPITPTESETTP